MSVPTNYASTVTVGQTGVLVSVLIINNSADDPSNPDVDSSRTVTVDSVFNTPSCDVVSFGGVCPSGSEEPGVFAIDPAVTPLGSSGQGLSGCTGTWTISAPDPVTGEVSLTPPGGPGTLVLGPSNIGGNQARCTVIFGVKILKLPKNDADPSVPEMQTFELARAMGHFTDAPDNTSTGSGSDRTTVLAAPLSCGDGVITPPETCDPPGTLFPPNNNPCREDCTFCGDGIVQTPETCDDGNKNNLDKCRNNCTRHLRNDPSWISFNAGGGPFDKLKVHGNFENDHLLDLRNEAVGVRLRDADNNVIFETFLSPGNLTERSMKLRSVFTLNNAKARRDGGIFYFRVMRDSRWYMVDVVAYGDISAADLPVSATYMTVEVFFGGERYQSSGTWTKGRKGWTLWGL